MPPGNKRIPSREFLEGSALLEGLDAPAKGLAGFVLSLSLAEFDGVRNHWACQTGKETAIASLPVAVFHQRIEPTYIR